MKNCVNCAHFKSQSRYVDCGHPSNVIGLVSERSADDMRRTLCGPSAALHRRAPWWQVLVNRARETIRVD